MRGRSGESARYRVLLLLSLLFFALSSNCRSATPKEVDDDDRGPALTAATACTSICLYLPGRNRAPRDWIRLVFGWLRRVTADERFMSSASPTFAPARSRVRVRSLPVRKLCTSVSLCSKREREKPRQTSPSDYDNTATRAIGMPRG